MNKPNHFITKIDLNLSTKLKLDLESQGFIFSKPNYTIFQAKKKGVSCTLYESGKLMVQGKDKDDFISFYLEPEILGNVAYTYPETEVNKTPRIGVDEAGKGDVFGPLCIAALYASSEQISDLIKLGIKDSKRLSDATIVKIASKIKASFSFSIIQILPKRYNELYDQFKNLNNLLAWGHATAIEDLVNKTNCQNVLIDQFAAEHVVLAALNKKKLNVNLSQRHKAEEDIVVAGASILARASFVLGIEKLSNEYNLVLPKGASFKVIEAGKDFVFKHGKEKLKMVAKSHFKTVDQITESS